AHALAVRSSVRIVVCCAASNPEWLHRRLTVREVIRVLVFAPRPIAIIGAHIKRLFRRPTGRTACNTGRRSIRAQAEIIRRVITHAGPARRIARVVETADRALRQDERARLCGIAYSTDELLVIVASLAAVAIIAVKDIVKSGS